MNNNYSKKHIDSRNVNIFKYRTFYNKTVERKNNIKKSKYKSYTPICSILKQKNIKTEFNYDKLYSYSNKKKFINEIKKYKDNKRRTNSNEINRFHRLYMHSKIKSFSDFNDNNNLTTNNKTSIFTETPSNNISNNKIKNKNKSKVSSLLKSINILQYKNYSKKVKNARNRVHFNPNILKTDNDIPSLFNSTTYKEYYGNESKNNNFSVMSQFNHTNRINKRIQNYFDENNKNLNKISLNLKPLSKPLNYKFNDVIGNFNNDTYCDGKLTSSRGPRNGLTEQVVSKFRYNVINKIKREFYLTQSEISQNPLSILKEYEFLQKLNKKYYIIFQDFSKRYFAYLYWQVGEEKHKLSLLKEERERLKEENFQITKKINTQKDKLSFYQNFMKLLMKIKYHTISINTIPEEEIRKYGVKISRPNYSLLEHNGPKKNYTRKNTYILITDLRDNYKNFSRKKTVINYRYNKNKINKKVDSLKELNQIKREFHRQQSSNKFLDNDYSKNQHRYSLSKKSSKFNFFPKTPIFNTYEELFDRLKSIENHLKELNKEYIDKNYFLQKLKMEKEKEKTKIKKDVNIVYNNIELENLNQQLIKIKEQNLSYITFKKFLISTRNDNNIEYFKKKNEKEEINNDEIDNNDYNAPKKRKVNFTEKVISILLKFNINIEKLIGCHGIYSFLKSPNDIKINCKGKEYMKTIFCVKVLEIIYFKLMEKRREYLSNSETHNKYLEYEEIIERNNKKMKIIENREREIKEKIKREKEIMIKTSKIVIPMRQVDSFSKNIYYEKIKKKEKGKKNKKNQEGDINFRNYFDY